MEHDSSLSKATHFAKGFLLTKRSRVSRSPLLDPLTATPPGVLWSHCNLYRHTVPGCMHLAVYALALKSKLARHPIRRVVPFIHSAHLESGVAYTPMLLALHLHPDLERFFELIECFFVPALCAW